MTRQHNYHWSDYCRAHVCTDCDHHQGLEACRCGWVEPRRISTPNVYAGQVGECPRLTTGQLRKMAQAAEGRLEWLTAADLWMQAVEVYPKPSPMLGALAESDIDSMLGRAAEACRYARQAVRA